MILLDETEKRPFLISNNSLIKRFIQDLLTPPASIPISSSSSLPSGDTNLTEISLRANLECYIVIS